MKAVVANNDTSIMLCSVITQYTIFDIFTATYFINFPTSLICVTRYVCRNMVYTYKPEIYAHIEYIIDISVFIYMQSNSVVTS